MPMYAMLWPSSMWMQRGGLSLRPDAKNLPTMLWIMEMRTLPMMWAVLRQQRSGVAVEDHPLAFPKRETNSFT